MEDSTTNSLICSIAILSRKHDTLLQRANVNVLTENVEMSNRVGVPQTRATQKFISVLHLAFQRVKVSAGREHEADFTTSNSDFKNSP